MLDRLRTRDTDDEGFTLVEVVVALTLFGILLATVSVALGAMLNKVRNNQNRTVAANIATRTIDRLHAIPASQLPNVIPDQVVQADGNTFTVRASSALVSDASGAAASACDGGGSLSTKRVTVTVVWSGMGSAQPVRSDTLRQLTFDELDQTRGSVSIRVLDRAGLPVGGLQLRLTPDTAVATTLEDGCAIFSNVPSGPHDITVIERIGWVDPQGEPTPSRRVTVVGGTLVKDPGFRLDQVGTINATYTSSPETLANYPVLLGTGLTLTNPALTGGSRGYATTAAGATMTGLFPFADGYRVWAGRCLDARPVVQPAAVIINPPAVAPASMPVANVRVSVLDDDGDQKQGQIVRVRHAADAGCPTGLDLTVRAPNNNHRVAFSLPAGTWSVSSGGGQSVTITALQPGGPRRDVTVRQP